jgi:membrane protease YdiL (CAAX protease family)
MEIYNNENNKAEKYSSQVKERGFFPRSEINDWLPIWEKIAFFLIGFIGIKIISKVIQRIIQMTTLVQVNQTLALVLINFLTYLLLLLAFLGFIFLDRRKTYLKLFNELKKPDTYIWALIGFGLVLGYQMVLGNLFTISFSFYGNNANESSIESMTKVYPVLMFIITVFFAPLAEEFTYRIGLVDSIGHKYQFRWLGVIISAIIFGCIHADIINSYYELVYYTQNEASAEVIKQATYALYNEWLNLPIYIGSGFFLALTYAKSGKISSSILAHMGLNCFSMIVSFINYFGK